MIERSTIVSSKLFTGCPDRIKILSALSNPLNAELLQQSADDISEPVVDESVVENDKTQEVTNKQPAGDSAVTEKDTKKSSGMNIKNITSEPKPITFKKRDEVSDEADDAEKLPEKPSDTDSEKSDEDSEVSTESSTNISGNVITASSNVEYIELNANVIKDTLNNQADTKGVVSVSVKNDGTPEMWIYYDDETNLNDTIYSVVSLFNSSGYNMVKFNRLARSNNAIVFDILNISEPIKSIVEVADET